MPRPVFVPLFLAPLCFALTACAVPEPFVRAIETGVHGRVDVAWFELSPPAGRPPVVLVNMVHVGDPRFFAEAQARLERAGVVLMEGISRDIAVAPASRTAGMRNPPRRIGAEWLDVAAAFRLVHQVEVLRVRPHFRNADISESEYHDLTRVTAGHGTTLRGLQAEATAAVVAFRREHPDLEASAAGASAAEAVIRQGRRALARLIAERAATPRRRSATLRTRNRIALRSLDGTATRGEVALCWGYAHASDLVAGLRLRGYRVVRTSWHDVFRY